MTCKCYDMTEYFRITTEGEFRAFGVHDKLVVLQGSKGVVVVCREGVYWRFDSTDDAFEVLLEPDTKDTKSFRLMPSNSARVRIQDILKAPSEDVELGLFVRVFGDRLEANYRNLLTSIREIGLNPMDYPRNRIDARRSHV